MTKIRTLSKNMCSSSCSTPLMRAAALNCEMPSLHAGLLNGFACSSMRLQSYQRALVVLDTSQSTWLERKSFEKVHVNTLPFRIHIPRWNAGRIKNQFQDWDLVRTRSRTRPRTPGPGPLPGSGPGNIFLMKITEFDLKWVHIVRYGLIIY